MKKWLGFALPVLMLASDATWKDKKAAEWTDDDAREVVTNSPWALKVTPEVERQSNGQRGGRSGGGMGRGGGIGIGIPGLGGIGGMGGGRRGGMGGPGGGYPGGQQGGGYPGGGYPGGQGRDDSGQYKAPDQVMVRWESATPVQTALLRLKESDSPVMDESHYAIVVTGLPARLANAQNAAKPKAELKRQGQKAIKSSEAKLIAREKDTIAVFYFPRSKEITAKDAEVDFETQLGRLAVHATFLPHDMTVAGKLEL